MSEITNDDRRVCETNGGAFRKGISPSDAISYYNQWAEGEGYDRVRMG